MSDLESFINLIRKQRHDFMNDLQVISGYLQTRRPKDALKYIDRLSKENEIISEIYRLQDNGFSLCLENNIKKLWQNEVKVEINIEISNFKSKIFEIGYNKKGDLLNTIFMELEVTNQKFVYIYIFEDELGESLLITNNEAMSDEMSWMDEWQQIETEIDDLRIYKCVFDNNIAYRLIFSTISDVITCGAGLIN
ncbi:Spo0B domain-containing protein [Clostridium sp. CF011]|uniref:Spo0B domain-containing protein n=1 Tax=unclassified Clostridium TaxID=2614128 RepID=UPI001C0BCF80|nr:MULTISPECIES: Spo0B domain-containing protein [unclassified Clostridium]MBU3090683.1 Spo0B domain-containing protein [Clostridium sp. CF011]MBW9144323.1 Spo0B domain-containing protein [Clostridium sp. CM027]UVE41044.1 Spo0B domain-containing protein [Clostridium sp. CM027]WAG70034.1 Spo0B domain-containing protein [Clostridium sp. CF011]